MSNIFESDIVDKVLFGGDYNPEQWDEETKKQDMDLLPRAGVDIATLNVFSWALLQPSEDVYDFTELDANVKMVTDNGMKICMATSTAAHPAWMARKYPEVLRTDFEGRAHKFGQRHNSCPNSPIYKKYSAALAGKLAEHYKDEKNIVIWHINNEYGGECYCENCERAFRVWLKDRYKTLDNLNYQWNTNFWSHTIYDWDEIVLPNALSEQPFGMERSCHPSITLDYKRFNSDSILQNLKDEVAAIRKHIPDAKITTNFMVMFKGLDYKKWADELDVISWDSYPQTDTEPAFVAFNHDIMRGLKNGKPFMLMEQTPSTISWQPVNTMKRPGVMRLISYQAVARGSDTIMYFQMRKSAASSEMYHGAIIDHSGRDDTRCYLECKELGAELKKLGDATLDGRTPARAAIIFDWDNWWTVEETWGVPYALSYPDEVLNYYRAFYELNIPVDIVGTKDCLDKYSIVAAPLLHMVKDGVEERLDKFVKEGGQLITGIYSGYVSESGRIILGGYPGPFKKILGDWVEETNMMFEDECNHFNYDGVCYEAKMVCDVVHCEGSESIAAYTEDYIQGMPAITVNSYGQGKAYYVGTTTDNHEFYRHLIGNIANDAGVTNVLGESIGAQAIKDGFGAELSIRCTEDNNIIYALNHQTKDVTFKADTRRKDLLSGGCFNSADVITLKPRQVMILRKE